MPELHQKLFCIRYFKERLHCKAACDVKKKNKRMLLAAKSLEQMTPSFANINLAVT